MKICHFDDIHQEHGEWQAPILSGIDVISLGGDIGGSPKQYLEVVSDLRQKNPEAFIVGTIGNHEHYGREIMASTKEYSELSGKVPGFEMLLGGRSVQYEDWRFIGATMWTAISDKWENAAQFVINDFRKIGYGDRRLLPSDVTKTHQATVKKIDALLSGSPDNSKTVVLTHHAPSLRSWTWTGREAKEREGAQEFYCANLDNLIKRTQPAVWLHGHIHARADYQIGATRVANNARGYARSHDLNPDFLEGGLVIDLSRHAEQQSEKVRRTAEFRR